MSRNSENNKISAIPVESNNSTNNSVFGEQDQLAASSVISDNHTIVLAPVTSAQNHLYQAQNQQEQQQQQQQLVHQEQQQKNLQLQQQLQLDGASINSVYPAVYYETHQTVNPELQEMFSIINI